MVYIIQEGCDEAAFIPISKARGFRLRCGNTLNLEGSTWSKNKSILAQRGYYNCQSSTSRANNIFKNIVLSQYKYFYHYLLRPYFGPVNTNY